MSMIDHYAIIHFGPLRGGFAMRMEFLEDALVSRWPVERIRSLSALLRFLRSKPMLRGRASVLVYSSLMTPLVALLKCFRPNVPVYYMVRGDEVTWARHAGRNLRAWAGRGLQKIMVLLGCRFVFASDDLREAFTERLGRMAWARVLPNTLGKPLPDIRPFDGRVAVVGDFGSVKNIEYVIDSLAGGEFRVDLYGNRSFPKTWKRYWLHAHGFVKDLKSRLGNSSLVVLSSVSEGFPNVLLDALEAGCGVVVHNDFPFRKLPVAKPWRFNMRTARPHLGVALPPAGVGAGLLATLRRLRREQPDFKQHNRAFVQLVESDWRRRVLDVFELGRGRREEGVAA